MLVERLLWIASPNVRCIIMMEDIHWDYELAMDEPTEEDVAARGKIGWRRWIRRLRRKQRK